MHKLSIILLSILAGTAVGGSVNNVVRRTEFNLLQLMVETRDHQRSDPKQSLACFDYYLQVFDDLNEEYRLGYAACLDASDDERRKIDAATQPERDEIELSAKSSCDALNVCTKHIGSVDYFSCFSTTGKENTESMYEISANAGETLAKVRESYRVIENSEYRCTNASERVYVEKTYKTNLELQSCLRGESSVPTTVAPPDTSTSSPETSPAPGETTADSTVVTSEPETSPTPGETTPDTTVVTSEPETSPTPGETTPGTTVVTSEPETSPTPGETTPDTTVVTSESETSPTPVETTPDTTVVTSEPETSPTPGETTPDTTVVTSEPETSPTPGETTPDTTVVTSEPETSPTPGETTPDTTVETTTESDFMPEEDLFAMRNLLARIKSKLALKKH